MPGCSALPPVGRRLIGNDACGDLDVGKIAELPQLLGGARILEHHRVDVEGVQFTGSVAVDGVGHVLDKPIELLLVVGGDLLACYPPLGLAGHGPRLASPGHAKVDSRS